VSDDLSKGESKLAQAELLLFSSATMKNHLKTVALVALVLASFILPARYVKADDDDQYSFKVHNATEERITKLLASEDGKDYVKFDIGKGIDAGETVTLNWDKSTNKSNCKWYIKAVFAGAGRDKVRAAILNPARLDPERQLEICMQCHLEPTSQPLPHAVRVSADWASRVPLEADGGQHERGHGHGPFCHHGTHEARYSARQ
jgi:hypothetical protein